LPPAFLEADDFGAGEICASNYIEMNMSKKFRDGYYPSLRI
jgi:hypothetical protein